MYETSVTRPDLFRGYFTEQIGLLMQNHGVPVEIGESDEPIPIHFAHRRDINIEASVPARDRPLRDLFDTPDLATIDDAIVNGTLPAGPRQPLAMFRAARVDYSLHYHYTGTDPECRGAVRDRCQIELDAGAHKKERNEPAEEDGIDLGPQRLAFCSLCRQPHDHASGESA
jgi:AMP nucleosidase